MIKTSVVVKIRQRIRWKADCTAGTGGKPVCQQGIYPGGREEH